MLLGIDLGTGSVKALLVGEDGAVLAETSVGYPVDAPQSGWAETDPWAWWQKTVEAVRKVSDGRTREIKGIGFSGQMHGVVLCREDGEPLRPAILWADTRSRELLERYDTLSDTQRNALANPITAGMAGPTLLWLQEHEPEVYQTARWALQPKDWLRLKLTGEARAEPSDASATLLYDLLEDSWAQTVVDTLGLRGELLAPLVASSAQAGSLTPEAAAELGLNAGIPVAAGAADTAAATFGSGLLVPGTMQLTVGTAAQIIAIPEKPTPDPERRTHLYRSAAEEGYYAMAAMQNAGIALEWVRKLLGVSWEAMYQEAFEVPPGSDGLTFLPYLTGERTPHLNPQARGSFAGMTLAHGRGHLARAAFEGVAFALKDGLRALQSVHLDSDALRLAGGGTLHTEWRQLLADILGKPLHASAVPAASGRGAALLGGIAAGVYSSTADTIALAPPPTPVAEPAQDDRLEQAYQRFRTLYPKLYEAEQRAGKK